MADLRDQLQSMLGTTYSVERELGGGGMSRVFVATETALGRKVVVKVLPPELSGAVSAERFKREIQLCAQLRHPHVVPLLSAGDAGGLLFYTMPLVEGESLRERLARGVAVPVGDVVRVLADVAEALAYAHGRGVVHRDVKPENVLLEYGHALVTDFGVAKALTSATLGDRSSATAAGLVVGTPRYMSPEQAAGDPGLDHRADLYALGVLAYELLTGAPPFGGRTHELVTAHLTAVPAPVAARRPDTPPALAALVARLLAKAPDDRPRSADEVLRELEALRTPSNGATAPGLRPPAARVEPGRPVLRRRVLLGGAATALVLSGYAAWSLSGGGRPADGPDAPVVGPVTNGPQSVAVLPFANIGGDTATEYFADGMADELTTALGRVPGLRVASRTSAFAFKGKRDVDVREIGRRLNVASVLEGTVQRAGGRMRVRAQLTNVSDNFALWSDSYERETKDVFQVQDDIARSITAALRVRLAGGSDALVERPTADLEAYDRFLKGRYAWNQRTGTSLSQAVRYFEQAVARDPRFARAHAGLAEAYLLLPFYGTVRPIEAWPKAKAAAERALALDSTLAEAHASLAYGKFLYERDWQGAEEGFRRALAADPRYGTAHQWYGDMLGGRGLLDERLREMRRAQELDPLSRIFSHEVAQTLFAMGRIDAATAQVRQTLELDPNFAPAQRTLGRLLVRQGMPAEGIRRLHKSLELSQRRAVDVANLIHVYAAVGQRDSAQRLLAELEDRATREYIAAFAFAVAYTGLGDKDRAFVWLNKAVDNYDPSLTENWFDPAFESLHSDPRWKQFLARMGVVE